MKGEKSVLINFDFAPHAHLFVFLFEAMCSFTAIRIPRERLPSPISVPLSIVSASKVSCTLRTPIDGLPAPSLLPPRELRASFIPFRFILAWFYNPYIISCQEEHSFFSQFQVNNHEP